MIDVRCQHYIHVKRQGTEHVVKLKAQHLQLMFAFSKKGNQDFYLTTTFITSGCLTLTMPNSHHKLHLTVAAMQSNCTQNERKKKTKSILVRIHVQFKRGHLFTEDFLTNNAAALCLGSILVSFVLLFWFSVMQLHCFGPVSQLLWPWPSFWAKAGSCSQWIHSFYNIRVMEPKFHDE